MVFTRSKNVKTFVRLPRYGRISLYQKMELEETKPSPPRTKEVSYVYMASDDDQSEAECIPIDDNFDASSIASTQSVCSFKSAMSSESLLLTPKKKQPVTDDLSFSPIPVKEVIVKESEYEQQRKQRIEENLKALSDLGVTNLIDLHKNVHQTRSIEKRVLTKAKNVKRKRLKPHNLKMNNANKKPRRSSPRFTKNTKGVASAAKIQLDFDIDAIAAMMKTSIIKDIPKNSHLAGEADSTFSESDMGEDLAKELDFVRSLDDRYYTCEEYFTLKGIKPKLIQENGKFSGWVEDKLRRKIGIAADKESAWLEHGGGKFSFKTPTGKLRIGSQSAKETARTMLFKNPNSYFYRHTAPGLDHWQGDWTEPENKRFLEVAKKYGVGNKWGLFATYIGHRVGYQCSNHYRAHFIEGGIIWDGNFMLDRYGQSIYVGRKNKYI